MFSPDSRSWLRAGLLAALVIFLPISAWLVSVSGFYQVGLIRDALFVIFLALTLTGWRSWQRPSAGVWLALFFVLVTLASYFTREDSVAQFLRGVRFLTEPLLLFAAIAVLPPKGAERILGRSLAISISLVATGAVIEGFFPGWLRLTLDSTARGYLGQVHLAGEARRLQSTLAGPNALGLFLMTTLLLAPVWFKQLARPVAIVSGMPRRLSGLRISATITVTAVAIIALLLTFSRSSYLGFVVGLIGLLIASRGLLSQDRRWLWGLLGAFTAVIVAVLVWSPTTLTRLNSNTIRFEQYSRVWNDRQDIGFWGRGAGAAGLSSVDRIDGGPNYFTENTYLDAYEATGPLGLITYLGFWLWLIAALWRRRTLIGATVGAAALGLLAAGFFINHYTGQAALWLTLIATAVALVPESQTS